jgi:hypothetical protein
MRKVMLIVMVVLLVLALAGCAAGPNNLQDTKNDEGKTAGFLRGLWHGFISFFTFIISIFTDKVSVYEVHNTGGWYDFGFILGIMIFYGGGSKGTCRRRERI